jgi:hypothetical protein
MGDLKGDTTLISQGGPSLNLHPRPGKVNISYATSHQTFGNENCFQGYQGDRMIPMRGTDLEFAFDQEETQEKVSPKEQEVEMEDQTNQGTSNMASDHQSTQLYKSLLQQQCLNMGEQ